MTLLIVTSCLTCVRPCISQFFSGKLEPILPTFFPGINESETVGYACLAAFHIYLLGVFAIGNAGSDLGLMVFCIHSYTMSKIFRNAVNEFNALMTKSERHRNASEIQASLNNLIQMHIDSIKLMKFLQNYSELIV